jgi:hypothetical protein
MENGPDWRNLAYVPFTIAQIRMVAVAAIERGPQLRCLTHRVASRATVACLERCDSWQSCSGTDALLQGMQFTRAGGVESGLQKVSACHARFRLASTPWLSARRES